MITYDAIVLGTGAVGSAALFHLAPRGRVLGLDRFAGAHDRGSSSGQSRMIREAYCEHPDYVPLVQRSFELWRQLEQRCGQRLYDEVGLIEVGPPDGLVVPGVHLAAQQHNLPVERLSEADVAERFPGFRLPPHTEAVFERRAGYLLAEPCVVAHQEEARRLGAELRTEAVVDWSVTGDSVTVRTEQGSYSAGRLIVAAGAWARDLLADLGVPLTVLKKPQNWFANQDDRYRADRGCPGFLFELPEAIFYGFPQIDERGVKIGEHTGGSVVADPLQVDRSLDVPQRQRIEQFLAQCLPHVTGPACDHSVCMYTMSPDGHFLVDRHPHHPPITFTAGLSGHGFKFAPVLGQALAELALDGKTELPIGFLGCERFGE